MRSLRSPEPSRKANGGVPTARIVWLTLPAMIGLIALGIFLKSPVDNSQESDATNRGPSAASATTKPKYAGGSASFPRRPGIDTPQTAEEIVAARLVKFSKIRGKFVDALAKRNHVAVPDEVRRFFEAAASGRWEEIDAAHEALLLTKEQLNEPRSAELHEIWRPIQETWGAAREAHDWPAQTLLDYGNSIMDTLNPGMIYAGGTDPGCFIPTMLNETGEDPPHIVITQNALADGTYLNYLNYLY